MKRDWRDFKSLYGNIEGARDGFEDACETLFRKKYPDFHVSKMAVKQGDGGIDIFIGEFGTEPIIVIQCKFFLDEFQESQQAQVRESFNRAIKSDKYDLKEWILCIPRVIDIDENTWWFKWKKKKIDENTHLSNFINLINGNELIDLMKEYNVYNQVFQIEDSLKIQEIHNALVPKKIEFPKDGDLNKMLFTNYTEKSEPYYLEREEDICFNQTLEISNIWIFGKSGRGKTSLINRNLIQNKIEYLFCDLSPISITSPDDIFEEIISSIEEKFDIDRCTKERNKIKSIVKLLKQINQSEIIIVIDEMSVHEETLLKSIASSFIQLVTYYTNSNVEKDLKFVVSTIAEPRQIILNTAKASDYFQYICCDNWEQHLENLFDSLNEALLLNIEESNKALIINKSKKSPRILKNIFRKMIIERNLTDESIKVIIDKTLQESL